MSSEDRLLRALAAPVAPAKDMRFTLEVMRRAEAERFRAEAGRRMIRAAAVAALVAAAVLPAAAWVAENADFALDGALAVAAAVAVVLVLGRIRAAPMAPR